MKLLGALLGKLFYMDYKVAQVAARLEDLTEHASDGLISADLLPWSASELWKSRLAAVALQLLAAG